MTEIREDLLTGQKVIVCRSRHGRPNDYRKRGKCPFCSTSDNMILPPIYESEGTFSVKVVPNKYPILEADECKDGAYGRHYVIIEGRDHERKLSDFNESEFLQILKAYQFTVKKLYEDPRIKYIQIFKNYGKEAGASLVHPHSQVLGIEFLPDKIKQEAENSEKYLEETGRCIFCDLVEKEERQKQRVIYKNEEFIAFCPYVSVYAYETCIAARDHRSSFLSFGDSGLIKLSEAIVNVLKRYRKLVKDIPCNIYFHFLKEENSFYHFHVEILPRIAAHAGLEESCGIISNPVSPEEAANFLR